jgi:hypothetical protein
MEYGDIKKDEIQDALFDQYRGEIPDYIIDCDQDFIVIRVSDWQGEKNLKIRIKDVIEYFKTQAHNIVSGMRSLAGHHGDWRPIDYLAQECLEYFKLVNIAKLRSVAIASGLEPKF